MAKQTISTIKNWFKTGLKPTQQQFWDWLDSYRHKDDKVVSSDVDGLQELLDAKVDKKDVVDPEVWDAAKPYVYDSDNQKYVSFLNPNSEDTQFKNEGFYRLLVNTAAGESPETHPAKWAYQGTVLGDITINDVIGLSEELSNKADLVAGKVPAGQLPTSDGITEGSTNQYNRQADWNQADSGSPDYIKNKPGAATQDVTRHRANPTISAGNLVLDVNNKNELIAKKSGGGGIDASGDFAYGFLNTNNAEFIQVFLNVSASLTTTLPAGVITASPMDLEAGKYQAVFTFDGANWHYVISEPES